MKGNFFANLQLVNTEEMQVTLDEVRSLVQDGFQLEKVSVQAYDVVQDQKYQAIQVFAATQSILDAQGVKVSSLMGRVKGSMMLASGSAGECQVDVQTGYVGGE